VSRSQGFEGFYCFHLQGQKINIMEEDRVYYVGMGDDDSKWPERVIN
jgi:hypothetical protein